MIDLTKLTPAPWYARGEGMCCGVYQGSPEKQGVPIDLQDPTWADGEFIAIARNAFDVMMRPGTLACCGITFGWLPDPKYPDGAWTLTIYPDGDNDRSKDGLIGWLRETLFPDPFTALVEAEKWYRENAVK